MQFEILALASKDGLNTVQNSKSMVKCDIDFQHKVYFRSFLVMLYFMVLMFVYNCILCAAREDDDDDDGDEDDAVDVIRFSL